MYRAHPVFVLFFVSLRMRDCLVTAICIVEKFTSDGVSARSSPCHRGDAAVLREEGFSARALRAGEAAVSRRESALDGLGAGADRALPDVFEGVARSSVDEAPLPTRGERASERQV
jgi:hypothetical protein